jgi:hypothetical protein
LISVSLSAQAPDTSWKFGGVFGVNVSQVGLRNWSGGGDNSLSLGSLATFFANYKHDKTAWDNSLELGYGVVKLGDEPLRKADDKIVLTSKYSRSIARVWALSAFVDFRSQFAKGFDYNTEPKTFVSNFLSPAYLTFSLGATYKPDDRFYAMLSPITGKATIVRSPRLSDAGAYGVKAGNHVRQEFGWLVNGGYKRSLMEGVTLETKLNLFSSYSDPKFVDVNWDTTILLKVNRYLSSSITTNVVYDNDIKDTDGKAKWQIKEVIAVGWLVTF